MTVDKETKALYCVKNSADVAIWANNVYEANFLGNVGSVLY